MKKIWISMLAVLLTLSLLLTSCVGDEPGGDNGGVGDSGASNNGGDNGGNAGGDNGGVGGEEPLGYTDLSAAFDPGYTISDEARVFNSSEGTGVTTSYVLSFDGRESGYSFASSEISGFHDAYTCARCTYTSKNGVTAFCFCDNAGAHSGITVILDQPISGSLVQGVKATVMSESAITSGSQLRIQPMDATDAADIVNSKGYPDVSGAASAWKTVDFGFNANHIASLADEDGYIYGFKLYFRDKDNTALYVKNISIVMSVERLCTVTALNENTYSKGDALAKIAQTIADNLTEDQIGAVIELRSLAYTPSTAMAHGSLTYKAIITIGSEEVITLDSVTTVLKRTEGAWLPLDEDRYGTARDAKEQWKTGFDKSGILALESNVLKASEGIARVEYAVIPKDGSVTDADAVWYAPHQLALNDDGIESLFINAYLDYGTALAEGIDYRLLVRGVTERENYVLHLDLPFRYSPLDANATASLEKAANALSAWGTLLHEEEGAVAYIQEQLDGAINDESIAVHVAVTADGVNSMRYSYTLSYVANVNAERFPTYTLGGEARSDFFAYDGTFFTVEDCLLRYADLADAYISLLSPADGSENVRTASDEVIRFWDTDADVLITPLYEYHKGELCDPVPVRLVWDAADNGEYTVLVAETPDFKEAREFYTTDEFYDLYSLKAGTRYYWRVALAGVSSPTYTFVTEDGYPRCIHAEGISNFRDIGGYITTDGKKVKQGVAFRLSKFDGATENDKDFINLCLNILTELDLSGGDATSPLGDYVQVFPISVQWYAGIFEEGESEPIREAISVFADARNYPLGYHCAVGRDRTGTVTILILGLLGVDEETILKDYMLSKLSVSGDLDNASARTLYSNFTSLTNGLAAFAAPASTFKEQVEAYLLSIGVTETQIESIRTHLLEE